MLPQIVAAIPLVSKLLGRFLPDKDQQEQNAHQETMALRDQVKAEWQAPEKNNWWNAFVDGMNRLIRPAITIWVCLLVFALPIYDLTLFQAVVVAYNAIPEYLWLVLLGILGFWFGDRMLMGARKTKVSIRELQAIRAEVQAIKGQDTPAPAETATVAQFEHQQRGDERAEAAGLLSSDTAAMSDEELARAMRAAEPMSLPSIVEWNRRRQENKK
jgi:hypothetical protein